MDRAERLKSDIEKLRTELQNLIDNREGNIDYDILTKSKMLDGLLNEYNRLMKQNNKRN